MLKSFVFMMTAVLLTFMGKGTDRLAKPVKSSVDYMEKAYHIGFIVNL